MHRLVGENGEDEPFAAAEAGHLVTAGRYDGLYFPGAACRIEILPEIPIATSDLEEFTSAYLRDAPFGAIAAKTIAPSTSLVSPSSSRDSPGRG